MEDKNAAQYFAYIGLKPVFGHNLLEVNNADVEKNNAHVKSLVTKYSNVSVYDVYEQMIVNNKIKISLDNDALYFDGDHLSYFGTFMHKQEILSKIDAIINSNEHKTQ